MASTWTWLLPNPTLEQWMQIAGAKSGAFFRLACHAGAAVATDQSATQDAFGDYGFRLGCLLQILDDLGDFRQVTKFWRSVLSGGMPGALVGNGPIARRTVLPQTSSWSYQKPSLTPQLAFKLPKSC